ncbi:MULTISPECIES: M24 family metallopeptidase [Achromobacter]|uniref:Aminopeptidase P family protein n=1 Tax=Achromobacter denitrificans TaxID=32002 RepID=A0A6J5H7N1_ACHDE|nr:MULTISPECIES: Xaa-Pro peptidase family protein [Achromobacter]MDF3860184.1 Xaa-Pro peptidase family protein [Achromobacter denitrificans]MDF3939107.1 Xaa-Pro peptidase family protein [Achromobacter denitrificans]QKQ49195.1 aminopeptidase P family protein [Achromobacter denitrificans]CAB3812692.1 Ectoine hydrolase [Achromobacter denitrificans]
MALHFPRETFFDRIREARKRMQAENLDALLLFAQESHYYLTGFDTAGYVFFQCTILTADDRPPILLTRRPDLVQAQRTSIVEDIRIWYDNEGADPSIDLKAILEELGLAGRRVGMETDNFGLVGKNHARVQARLADWCKLVDASHLVRALRVVKSEAELRYVREAASLADDSLLAMLETARPGAFEGDIAAAGAAAQFRGGGDPPPGGPVLGSGDRALLVRTATGYRHLDDEDQLTLEFAASYRHYCACLMRTVAIGKHDPRQERMFDITLEALTAMTAAALAGNPLGDIDQAHRRVFDRHGYGHARMAACGYSLGATFRPSWMDVPPLLFAENGTLAEPGMVLFLHAILIDTPNNLAMSLGHTLVVSESGAPEVLSKLKPTYRVCR